MSAEAIAPVSSPAAIAASLVFSNSLCASLIISCFVFHRITVFSDSELLVKHINHQYKIKEGELQVLFLEVWNLMLDFKQVNFQHTLRGGNKEADALVNQALDEETSKQTLL